MQFGVGRAPLNCGVFIIDALAADALADALAVFLLDFGGVLATVAVFVLILSSPYNLSLHNIIIR